MCPRPVNIDIAGSGFAARLTRFREQRQLTKADLAARAQVSYRTVHELESGNRDRIQEKTALLLAEALGITAPDLLGNGPLSAAAAAQTPADSLAPPADGAATAAPGDAGADVPRPPGRRLALAQPWAPFVLLSAAVVAVAAAGWLAGVAGAVWSVDGGVVTARHAVLGHDLWRWRGPGSVAHVEASPWSRRILLISTRRVDAAASPLLALDRRTGRVLWRVTPDVGELEQAFGREIMSAGSMYAAGLVAADLYAERSPVLVVNFRHSLYYPTCLCVVDRRGRRRAQYSSKGHIDDLLVADVEGDGTEAVLAVGTNNDPAYQGATAILLDARHFRGVTGDALATPDCALPDSARFRVVLPQYPAPYMKLLGLTRLHASSPQLLQGAGGEPRFSVLVGLFDEQRLIVFLDAQLRPLRADATDAFLLSMRRTFPDTLRDSGPADPAWRQRWLKGHVHFAAGHWPPAGGTAPVEQMAGASSPAP